MMPLPDWAFDNCATEPVTFVIEQLLKEPTGTVEQCDEAGRCYAMPVYSEPTFVFGELWDSTVYPQAHVLTPAAGSAIFLGVQAMDEAGNVSRGEGACQ